MMLHTVAPVVRLLAGQARMPWVNLGLPVSACKDETQATVGLPYFETLSGRGRSLFPEQPTNAGFSGNLKDERELD